MIPAESGIAKITRPKLSQIAPRERLFRLLDRGGEKPVIWIASPAGSGKTTLAASWIDARKLSCLWYQVDQGDGDLASFFYYMGLAAKKAAPRYKSPLPLLTPEYLQSIPIFTRRYFEELFSRLKPPTVIIFDNYQDAPQDSGFNEMMGQALETVPEGMHVVILSRNDPPPQLVRLVANNRLQIIGWDDVRFTPDESGKLLTSQGRGTPDKATAALLYEKTDGWAAGLVLLMARASTGGIDNDDLNHVTTTRGLFDYFASEIFDKTDTPTQHFLLVTSFLPRVMVPLARELTGVKEAGLILERLSRQHYFTQKYAQGEPAYQYHPLFHEFLLARAQSYFDAAELLSIKRKTAALLRASGRNEDAALLLRSAEDWKGLTHLILSQAQTLVRQGRSSTLEEWITAMPKELVGNSSWLLYWLAVCRLVHDPIEAREILERAYRLFTQEDDVPGLFLSWASLTDTFLYAWSDFRSADRWIAEAYRLIAAHPVFPSPEIEARVASGMFSVMLWGRPQHPDLPEWADRLSHIILGIDNSSMRIGLDNSLLLYYIWMGDFSKAAIHFEVSRKASRNLANDPLALQWWWGVEAGYSWITIDHEACVAAIANGVKLGEKTGVHLLDFFLFTPGIWSGVSLGHPEYAEELLRKMENLHPARTLDKVLYHFLAAAVKWYRGDLPEALAHGEQALRFSEESASPFAEVLCRFELAVTLFDVGRHKEAGNQLGRAQVLASGLNLVDFVCRLFGAWFAFRQGDEAGGVTSLRQAMAIGAKQRYVNFTRWRPEMMSLLCAKALEHGIETEYARLLISIRKLPPPDIHAEAFPQSAIRHQQLDHWPYPVRITTLGRFQIVKDDEPVTFTGKVQKKPLEMLKALISFGGTDVSEERITEALWPDADGDAAHRSFESALYRLRKLVGENTVRLQDGLLTIDRGYCRVDAWDFSRLAQEGTGIIEAERDKAKGTTRAGSRGNKGARIPQPAEKALVLYRGPFLPADLDQPWSLSLRERLRDSFIGLVNALGRSWERSGEWERAAACFRKGLETEEHAEEFYQHLMVCHRELGQHAQAEAVYRQCRAALARTLGLAPSPKTEELRASLKKNGSHLPLNRCPLP